VDSRIGWSWLHHAHAAWIELHRDELQADWELAVVGENPYKINPL